MISINIDNLSVVEARALFNALSEEGYLSNAECNLNAHNSSVRLESYQRNLLLADLVEFFQ
jgi:hypothetical protein